jgi:hypothetical protein
MIKPDGIDLDTPLRLNEAVKIAFPLGGMTVSGLRREIKRDALGRCTIHPPAGDNLSCDRDTPRLLADRRSAQCGHGRSHAIFVYRRQDAAKQTRVLKERIFYLENQLATSTPRSTEDRDYGGADKRASALQLIWGPL